MGAKLRDISNRDLSDLETAMEQMQTVVLCMAVYIDERVFDTDKACAKEAVAILDVIRLFLEQTQGCLSAIRDMVFDLSGEVETLEKKKGVYRAD